MADKGGVAVVIGGAGLAEQRVAQVHARQGFVPARVSAAQADVLQGVLAGAVGDDVLQNIAHRRGNLGVDHRYPMHAARIDHPALRRFDAFDDRGAVRVGLAVALAGGQGRSIGEVMAIAGDQRLVHPRDLRQGDHVGTQRQGQDRLEGTVDATGLGQSNHVLEPDHDAEFAHLAEDLEGVRSADHVFPPLLLQLLLDHLQGGGGNNAVEFDLLLPESGRLRGWQCVQVPFQFERTDLHPVGRQRLPPGEDEAAHGVAHQPAAGEGR